MDRITFTTGDIEQLENNIMLKVGKIIAEQNAPIWFKTSDAEKYLNCNQSTLISLRNKGVLPCYKLGGTVYYKKEDIDRTIEDSRQ